MLNEWTGWLSGIQTMKKEQGMLLLFCVCLIWYFWRKKEQSVFWGYGALSLALVVFPVTAAVFMKGYTAFYGWSDLFLIVPVLPLLAAGGVECSERLKAKEIPGFPCAKGLQTAVSIAIICLIFIFSSNFHSLEIKNTHTDSGVPSEIAEAFSQLADLTEKEDPVIAASSGILPYVRMYNMQWQTLYGRDLWDGKAASYIASGYDREYVYYELLEAADLSDEDLDRLEALIQEGDADCVIVPSYWINRMEEIPGYETVMLTDSYAGILKKEIALHE